jgi:CMP-N-acetylneuraminic acid synthetase
VTAAAPVIHLVKHLRNRGEPVESVCMADPSSPLVIPEDFREAWRLFQATDVTVLHGVGPFEHPPQRAVLIEGGIIRPLYGMEMVRRQSEQLAPAYFFMGSPLFAKVDHLISTESYYADRMAAYAIPPERAVDVDTAEHLAYAEFLLRRRQSGRTPS